jgi:hypothetical protein
LLEERWDGGSIVWRWAEVRPLEGVEESLLEVGRSFFFFDYL